MLFNRKLGIVKTSNREFVNPLDVHYISKEFFRIPSSNSHHYYENMCGTSICSSLNPFVSCSGIHSAMTKHLVYVTRWELFIDKYLGDSKYERYLLSYLDFNYISQIKYYPGHRGDDGEQYNIKTIITLKNGVEIFNYGNGLQGLLEKECFIIW